MACDSNAGYRTDFCNDESGNIEKWRTDGGKFCEASLYKEDGSATDEPPETNRQGSLSLQEIGRESRKPYSQNNYDTCPPRPPHTAVISPELQSMISKTTPFRLKKVLFLQDFQLFKKNI